MADTEERPSIIPASARRETWWFLGALGATAVLYLLPTPFTYGMILTGPAAAVLGAVALLRSRAQSGVVAYRVWVGIGMLMGLFSAVAGVTTIVFADVLSEYQSCLDRAVTQQAQDRCNDDYRDGVESVFEDLLERAGVSSTA